MPALGTARAIGIFDIDACLRERLGNRRERTGFVQPMDEQHFRSDDQRPILLENSQRRRRIVHHHAHHNVIDGVTRGDRVDINLRIPKDRTNPRESARPVFEKNRQLRPDLQAFHARNHARMLAAADELAKKDLERPLFVRVRPGTCTAPGTHI